MMREEREVWRPAGIGLLALAGADVFVSAVP